MNYGAIKNCDISNGPGCRVSLFVSGCTHHCPGCFNPETWDFRYGQKYTSDTLWEIVHMLEPKYISGLSILGGEPMDIRNMIEVYLLMHATKYILRNKSIWIYSGSTFEELQARTGPEGRLTEEILSLLDVLVDGPFIEAQKNISLQFRGSENQRIIDMPRTRKAGQIVLWEG